MKHQKILTWIGIAVGIALTIAITHHGGEILKPLETAISQTEQSYQKVVEGTSQPQFLLPLAFGGGLIASVSPCILALLPVNLSYIGTLKPKSRRQALWNATSFVMGVISILSVFGLFSSVAGAVIVDWRGYINLGVGVLICLMGMSLAGLYHLPLPQNKNLPSFDRPYGVGLTFALVSSPCASPVLFAVLAAAAATGSPLWSTLAMVAYAIGYTAIIFAASLFTGVVTASRSILTKSETISKWSGLILIVMGGYYLISGILWFF
jgi:cytochrome c-type biogenesis protein